MERHGTRLLRSGNADQTIKITPMISKAYQSFLNRTFVTKAACRKSRYVISMSVLIFQLDSTVLQGAVADAMLPLPMSMPMSMSKLHLRQWEEW
jgi:hypothetical protein